METFDSNGHIDRGDGNIEIDPTHPNYRDDRRYDSVRNAWVAARGAAKIEEASPAGSAGSL